jgi:hypothetical protein
MSADRKRELWEARFDVGVGPLRFGMTPAGVAQVLSCEPQPRAGGPYGEEDYPNGVRAFYDAESLACVALDAVVGPQAFLAGFPLEGSDPGRGRQFLIDRAREHGKWILFTPDGLLALTDVGILLRDQCVGGVRLSRPVFVNAEWLESEYYRDHLPLEGVID